VTQIQNTETSGIEFSLKSTKKRSFACARLTQEQGINRALVKSIEKGLECELEVGVLEGILAGLLTDGRMHHGSFVWDGREICPSS
jgi:hypothetical protein